MRKGLIFYTIIESLLSCNSYKTTYEYIQFHHRNYLKVANDETDIVIFPKKNNEKSIIVKVTGSNFNYKRKANLQDYEKMKDLLLSLKQKDIEIPEPEPGF